MQPSSSTHKPINDLFYPSFLHCHKFSSSTNIVGIVGFTGFIEELLFKQALKVIQQRHPLLAVRIEDATDTHLTTHNVPEIPLQIIPRVDNSQWREITTAQLHTPLPLYTGPFVRVVYLAGQTQGEIIWIFDHLVVDGMARSHIAIEFFEIIQAIKDRTPVIQTPDNSWSVSRENALQKPQEKVVTNQTLFVNSKQVSLAANRRTNFIPYDFTEEQTSLLQEKYRHHKSSLQGALSAAMAQVVAENVSAKTGEQAPIITCHHPINLRPYLTPRLESSDLGAWFSMINQEIAVDSRDDVWDLARSIKEQLHTSLARNEHIRTFCPKALNPELSDFDVFMNVQASRPMVAVSQIGTVPVAESYSDLSIQSIRGLYNWSVLFNHEDIFTVTGLILKKRLLLTFVYIQPYVQQEQAQRMAEKVVSKLLQ